MVALHCERLDKSFFEFARDVIASHKESKAEQEQSDDLSLAGLAKTAVQPKHPFWPVRD